MSSVSAVRSQLYVQAAVTAAYGLLYPRGGSGWTIMTMVVAAAAVFVGSAVQPLPAWRSYVIGFEGCAVGYGALALVSHHYVPGTIIATGMLLRLLQSNAALAFAGTPGAQTWAPVGPPPPAWAPPAPVQQWTPPPIEAPTVQVSPFAAFTEPPAPVELAPVAPAFTPTPLPDLASVAPAFMPTPFPVEPLADVPVVPVEAVPLQPRAAAMTILPSK